MSREHYAALVEKVDAFTARAEAAQAGYLQCHRGCDGCCRVRRTAWAVEVDAIRRHLDTLPPERVDALRGRPITDDRCVFLDDDGACAVYLARPLLCRTHGPAVIAEGTLRWCELNFEGLDEAEVSARISIDDILETDRLNAMLALVNQAFITGAGGPERAFLDAALEG